jgi:uncharacterized protein with von Willebrand factor type A (vWA) domain
MRFARYIDWDGQQELRLDPDEIFQAFAAALSKTDDASAALEMLLRDGFMGTEARVVGLDELREHVAEERRRLEDSVNLNRALDDLRDRLDEAVAAEKRAAETSTADEARKREAQAFLEDLGPRLSTALERILARHPFAKPDTQRELGEMAADLDSIRRVEEAQRRLARRLQGPASLDFEQTLEFLDRLEALERLEEALANGDLAAVDPAELGSLLGAEAQAGLEALQGMVLALKESGHLREREGRVELTPQAVRKLGQLALRDIYEGLMRDRSGGHESQQTGAGPPSLERTRPWDFGDPLRLALVPTLMGAVRRGGGMPLALDPSDFVIQETEQETSVATVLLLDMSWSMSWEGRFAAAKKVALALETLVRTRFPRDYFGMVGFYTKAVELTPLTLPEATWSMGDPFTNLQDGLRMAGRLLQRHAGRNQQIIVITDGQPTAYYADGQLHCEWPMSMGGVSRRAAEATLGEVARLTRRGVTINTFMLDDSDGLRAFVDEMTRLNRGRALYTRPDQLGSYLMVDYFGRKTKRL